MKMKSSSNTKTIFEKIKKINAKKMEFWSPRDLAKILEYSEFRHFKSVIDKAKDACKNSGQKIDDHFEEVLDKVVIYSKSRQYYPLSICMLSNRSKC